MNVYLQELKMAVSSAIYWTIGLLLMMTLYMMMFPALSKDVSAIQEIFNNFPPEFVKALGLTTFDLSNIIGFYGYLFTYILLIGSVYAMKSGISVLSEEVRSKTSDFLVAKPISRNRIVTAKLMSVLTLIIIQNIIYTIGAFTVAHMIATTSFNQSIFLLINVSLFLVQLFFVALGLLISVLMKKIKTVLPITLGIVFGFFIIQMLNQSLDDAKLAYITPFAYFDAADIIESASFDITFFILNMIIILIFTVLTYFIYNKRDMSSV